MSYKPEVRTVNDPKWYRNGLVFATKEEAENSAFNLMMKWSGVEDYRAVEVDEPVTHRIVDGKQEHVG